MSFQDFVAYALQRLAVCLAVYSALMFGLWSLLP